MDPFTHYMAAWLIGKKLNIEEPYWKLLVFSALLPDIDIFLIIFGWQYESLHAIYTHTILGIIVLAIPTLLAFRYLYKIQIARAIPYYLLGFLSHLFLDIFNWRYAIDYSQRFLWPLSSETFNLFYLLGIPSYSSFGFGIFVLIFLLAFLLFAYFIMKKDYPWLLWQKELVFLKSLFKSKN